MSKDYYAILGVEKSASQDEIKKAFRKQAHQYHPDKAGGDEAKFKEVNEAYQVLSDENKRAQYDQFGSSFDQAGAGFNWQDFARGQAGGHNVHFDFGDLGDMFGDFFGGGRSARARGPQQGAHIEHPVTISFLDAVHGTEETVTIKREILCSHCNGNKAEPGTKLNTCGTCNGSGQETFTKQTMFGAFQTARVCSQCKGEGTIPEKVCTSCQGAGRQSEEKEFKVTIPAGIDHGEAIKITGEGHAGHKGGPPGDIYVIVRVNEHGHFNREGYTIHTTEKVAYSLAALGGHIEVETIDGPVKVKIPAGTQHGQVIKLKGKGITRIKGFGRGPHLLHIVIEVPTSLSRSQKKALSQLSDQGL